MVALGEQIRTMRGKKRLTQQQLAYRLHISASALAALEQGKNPPTLATALRLARVLGRLEWEYDGKRLIMEVKGPAGE